MSAMKPLFILLAATLLVGCSRHTKLTVVNASGVELTKVVASGSDFSVSVGTLATGQERRLKLPPRGGSSLSLAFDANGKSFSSPPDGYFETGFTVTATVAPDFTVKVEGNVK
jgi:hypothetical protein